MMLVGNVHLCAGGSGLLPDLYARLMNEGIKTVGNPDVYVREYAHFGVDEARELCERAALGAVSATNRVFIVIAPGMTTEAQNVLLKTLEEPPADAMFFIIVPSPTMLLPTLRSRAQLLALPASRRAGHSAEEFLSATAERRLELLKPLLEKGDNERRDMGELSSFLASLETALEKHVPRGEGGEGLRAVYRARKFLSDKGALVKPLLEHVALLVPRK